MTQSLNAGSEEVVAELQRKLAERTAERDQLQHQQMATADILTVIAGSPSDVQPVFDAIAERANRLVNGLSTAVYSIVDDVQHLMAFTPISPEADAALKAFFPAKLSNFTWGETIRKGEVFQIADTELAELEFAQRDMGRLRGWRSFVLIPLLRANRAIGLMSVTRVEPGRFADHHVQLLKTFADQAVIAIASAETFRRLQDRTSELAESLEQQTATSEVLGAISSSPGDLQPVFQTMLDNATRVCHAKYGQLFLYEEDKNAFRAVATTDVARAWSDFLVNNPLIPADPAVPLGRAATTKAVVHVSDASSEQGYLHGFPGLVAVVNLGGARTLMVVPMLKEDQLVGALGLYRLEVLPFTDKQTELVKGFANQAVIAIENARLLKMLRQRTDDLTVSLNDLRTAQDRLVQTEKLASLGQLTAGIAHEIKNPLNFVNNFSALSAELVDEMTEVFENPALDEAGRRKELDEIRELLKGNLDKVVQHGKRADSIVKNMLLHSREGSGEHRSADVNVIVEDSLNLAYHGARAEKAGFSITLKHDLDPDAGALDLYPQEITRALLNLIFNGFYAATRRKVESGDENFEPVLSASTRNLGTTVEIRIRDNGTGIPSDVKEKMFNPFFTTKPTGEGTGLGLSMTHDIIVKQHGGRIDVETESGAFTEFIITLPRNR
jgi:signal transduction histidine kinase